MKVWKKCIGLIAALALCLTGLPMEWLTVVQAAGAEPDVSIVLRPGTASPFNDTDGDGLGEFQGWGTSLCWWANRVGYDPGLVEQAAEMFYGDTGLDLNIGRYNIGGGDLVGEVEIQDVPVNEKAEFYDLETEGRMPTFAGSSMEISENTAMASMTYNFSDADFGFTKGSAVGNFKQIGWINQVGAADDSSQSGGNLHYTVNAAEAGEYTVKLLLTLTGSNSNRNVAIRVNQDDSQIYSADRATIEQGKIVSEKASNGSTYNLYVVTLSGVALQAGENPVDIGGIQINEGDDAWTLDFVKMAVIKQGEEGVLPEEDEFLHEPHITRSDSAIPGYATDVVRISTSGKTADELRSEGYARVDEESDFAWNYDWDADKNQMSILKAAAKASGADFLAEAFSNSPPYFMTNSGCSSGNFDANTDNLKADCYNAFAAYMADVIEHWNNEGVIKFTSTTPMNEPYTNYWGAHSNKQEGCHFDIGTSESKIIVALNKELQAKGIDIVISGTDETSIDTQIQAYNALTEEAKNVIERIDTHTYSGSNRAGLSELAETEGKNLWMSEIDGNGVSGTNAGEMGAALWFAERIKTDVSGLRSSAWIMWNAVDMHIDANNPFDPDSYEQLLGQGTNDVTYDPNQGYWGIAIGDHNNKTIIKTRKYYAYGQFSRYIRPGYTIIGSSGNTLAAYDPDGQKAVIVAINTAGSDQTWKFDLSRFQSMGSKIQAIRTSGSQADGESWADVTAIDEITADTEARSFTAVAKANSITTYIVEGVEYDGSEEPVLTEITIDPDTMVTGSAPWNNGANDAKKAFDGNLDTFFDGVTEGYIQVDFGVPVKLDAIEYAPRSGYAYRMPGASFYGSNDTGDEKSWTKLYTISAEPAAGILTRVYAEEFTGMEREFRYLKYSVPAGTVPGRTEAYNCNVAEIKVYGKYQAFTEAQIAANDYVLYLANCGTPDPAVVPKGYQLGLYQTVVDQRYSEDESGFEWGLLPDDANSIVEKGGTDPDSITGSYINMSPSITHVANVSGLKYNFELPDRLNGSQEYEVIVGVACPWSNRNININLEGKDVDQDITVGQSIGTVEKTYRVTVEDQELNVMVHSPNRTSQYGDPVLSYIIVKAVPDATLDALRDFIDSYLARVEGNQYSEASREVFDKAIEAGEALIDAESDDSFAIQEAMDNIKAAYEALKQIFTYTSITGTNGDAQYDNNGNLIQAHGGQVQKWGDTYYWYGEDKSNDYRPVVGVHLYTSKDLYNWTDEGVVLKSVPVSEADFEADLDGDLDLDLSYMKEADEGYFASLYAGYEDMASDEPELYDNKLEETYWNLAEDRCVIERPKVLYNEKNDNYVMWFHADGRTPTNTADYGKARAGIAVSDKPEGPFKLLGTYMLATGTEDHGWDSEGGHVRDMGVFQDDDGSAYVIYSSEGNSTMYVAKLNDDYTGLVKDPEDMVLGEDFVISSTNSREAPAVLKYKDMYYMITSGTSGWNPNAAQYAVAEEMLGDWTAMGDPCIGSNFTFYSQSTFVIPVDPENGKFIYMGDRWYNPEVTVGPGAGGALRNSRYMWLPIEFGTNHTMTLRDYSDWTLEDLENKGSFEIVSELPTVIHSVADAETVLPQTVSVDYGTEVVEEAVTWETGSEDANKLGVLTVTGTITSTGRTFTHALNIVNPDLIYFFDSGSVDSAYFDVLKEELGFGLRNDVPDETYADSLGAGYTGATQDENPDDYDLGHRDGSDYLSDGWWAGSNRDIEYAFDLEAGVYTVATGYQEWWSTSRPSLLTVAFNGETVAEKNFTVASTSRDLQVDQQFTITESGTVTVTVSKIGNPDPVISWIAVIRNESNDPKADLKWLIKKAESLNGEDYMAESWAALLDALEQAKVVAADETADAEVIEAAKDALIQALEALEPYAVDKEALIAAIESAPADSSKYTAESWAAYEEALAAAIAVRDDESAEQTDVDSALEALLQAQDDLVTLDEVIMQAAEDFLVKAGEADAGSYTEESWASYWNALQALQSLYGKEGVTEEEINAAIKAVEEAYNALTKIENTPTPSGEPTDTPQPTDEPQPTDGPQPTNIPQPSVTQQPTGTQQPGSPNKPAGTQQPGNAQKPAGGAANTADSSPIFLYFGVCMLAVPAAAAAGRKMHAFRK